MCRSIVLVEHGIEGRGRNAEDISRLEQEVAEARENLRRSFAANDDLSANAVREAAEKGARREGCCRGEAAFGDD